MRTEGCHNMWWLSFYGYNIEYLLLKCNTRYCTIASAWTRQAKVTGKGMSGNYIVSCMKQRETGNLRVMLREDIL